MSFVGREKLYVFLQCVNSSELFTVFVLIGCQGREFASWKSIFKPQGVKTCKLGTWIVCEWREREKEREREREKRAASLPFNWKGDQFLLSFSFFSLVISCQGKVWIWKWRSTFALCKLMSGQSARQGAQRSLWHPCRSQGWGIRSEYSKLRSEETGWLNHWMTFSLSLVARKEQFEFKISSPFSPPCPSKLYGVMAALCVQCWSNDTVKMETEKWRRERKRERVK